MAIKMVRLKEVEGPDDKNLKIRGYSYWFWCPGCQEVHRYSVRVDGGTPSWTFNGDVRRPEFSPSLRLFTTHPETGVQKTLCHLFLRTGRPEDNEPALLGKTVLDFCGDCDHPLSGRRVLLPPIPEGHWLLQHHVKERKT